MIKIIWLNLVIIFIITLTATGSITTDSVMECDYMSYPDGYNCRMLSRFDTKTKIAKVKGFHNSNRNNSLVDVLYISSFNPSQYVPINSCDHFENLKKFDMAGESVVEFTNEIFFGCKNISEVIIKNSKINSINFDLLTNLEDLKIFHLENTKVEYIHEDFFKNNVNLKKITLDRNQLKVIDVIFSLFDKLELLSVLTNPCISLAYSKDDPRSPPLTNMTAEINNHCNNNTNLNVLSTTPPLVESSIEQRLNELEIALSKAEDATKVTADLIQQSITKVTNGISKIREGQEEHKKSLDKLKPSVDNITKEYEIINQIGASFKNYTQRIMLNFQKTENSLDSIKDLEKQNTAFRKDIEHTENLMWGLFAVQCVTIAFAVYITVYVKFN